MPMLRGGERGNSGGRITTLVGDTFAYREVYYFTSWQPRGIANTRTFILQRKSK